MTFLRTLTFSMLIGLLSAVDSQASFVEPDFNENIRTSVAASTACAPNEFDVPEDQQSNTRNTTKPIVYCACSIGLKSALVGTLVATYAVAYVACNADCGCQALSIYAGGFGYLVIDLIRANLGLS